MALPKCTIKFPAKIIFITVAFLIVTWAIIGNLRLNVGNPLTKDILQSIFPSFKKENNSCQPPKRILFWTAYFEGRELQDFSIFQDEGNEMSQKSICKFHCEFTTNRSLINSSHAVLFHGKDLKPLEMSNFSRPFQPRGKRESPVDLPQQRMSDQYWIFYIHESPIFSGTLLKDFDNIFNLTVTYRTDSDIYAPYKQLLKHKEKLNNYSIREKPEEILKGKPKLVAWIVSHCTSQSFRAELVLKLGKYLPIDVYGACGKEGCPEKKPGQTNCYNLIGKSYKFYLALENSLCQDYVTEKMFNALDAGMVPIVYGGADYLRHAPEGSFINVHSFPSIKALADYILMLDQNPHEYLKYFEWKQKFYVDHVFGLARAWCTLCEKLTTGDLPRQKVIKDLQDWWHYKENFSACSSPKMSWIYEDETILDTNIGFTQKFDFVMFNPVI